MSLITKIYFCIIFYTFIANFDEDFEFFLQIQIVKKPKNNNRR